MRRILLLALSLLGLWDSAYLLWVYASPSHALVCVDAEFFKCDVVRASSYAQWWGLPTPAYGAAMYATLVLLIFAAPLAGGKTSLWIGRGLAAISGAGLIVSLLLTRIEAFVLHAWCEWCLVSALTVTCIFGLALFDLIRPAPPREPHAALAALRRYFLVLLIAFGAGTPAFVILARQGEVPPPQPVAATVLAEHLIRPDSHRAGNAEAAATVVEFGDFECPLCGRVQPVVEEIRRKYGNRIRFVFRQFPLTSLHMYAETAAEASECAAEQGKFWEAEAKFYQHQDDLSELALERYARELGLDPARFHHCLVSGAMAARVKRDVNDAHALGLRGTPAFFIGERGEHIIQGPVEVEQLSRLIDQELAAHGAQAAQVNPLTSGSTSAQGTAGPGGSVFGSASNPFAPSQSSELACSEDEAKKRQPTLIRTAEAEQYFKSGSKAVFVDVRSPKDFKSGRIPSAINVPVDDIEKRWKDLPKDRTIVLYESGLARGDDVCASSRAAGRVLLAHGFPFERVKVYQDGFAAWKKTALPVKR